MIVTVALKEFYTNLVSVRFTIGFILCLFLIPFTMIVSINDYSSQVMAYEMDRKQAEQSMSVRVYSQYRPEIVKPPEPLSIFSRGISQQVGNGVKVLFGEIPLMAVGRGTVRDNPLLNAFFSLDFVTIVAIIMSLLALLFTYDACTGEREKGTLKLVLVGSTSRSTILLGKILGVSLTLLPMILFCYVLSALIILFYPGVSFSAPEWGRIVLMLLMSILFFALFMAIGLFVSSRLRSSTTSIVVCLFVWVTVVFIAPNMAVYAAQSFVKTDSRENLTFSLRDIDSDFNEKIMEYRNTLDQPDWWMHWNMSGGGDGYREITGSSRSLMELYRHWHEYSEPLRVDYADKKWALQEAYLEKLERQRLTAERLSFLSPSELFRQSACALCRTDAESQYRFLNMARRYRETLIQYYKDENIFGSWEYFTRQDPETFMIADEIVRIRTGGEFQTIREYSEWARAHSGSFTPLWKVDIPGTNPSEFEPLDLSNVPQFIWTPSRIAGDFRSSLGKLTALVLAGIVLFYLSFVSFTRYDVR